jgi:hypothetical protein
MRMTRPSRRSPIRLLSASRNNSLKASWSLNRIAGPSLGAGRSFEGTDHRAIGERTPRDLNSSVERVDQDWARRGREKRLAPVQIVVSVQLFGAVGVFNLFRNRQFKGADIQVERIVDLVELDRPAFAPNGSKGAQR